MLPAERYGRSPQRVAFGSCRGGIVCLLLILPPIVRGKSDPLVVRGSFVFTALFFALSSLPLFLWVKEQHVQRLAAGRYLPSLAYRRLAPPSWPCGSSAAFCSSSWPF